MRFAHYQASSMWLGKPTYGFQHHGPVPVIFRYVNGSVLPETLMHPYLTVPPHGLADSVVLLRKTGLD